MPKRSIIILSATIRYRFKEDGDLLHVAMALAFSVNAQFNIEQCHNGDNGYSFKTNYGDSFSWILRDACMLLIDWSECRVPFTLVSVFLSTISCAWAFERH